jgi:membrane protease YdiL (CAAX protease family)
MLNRQRAEILSYAAAVLIPTTLISVCLSLFLVTNNWAANALMFIPGLMAALCRLRWREGFKPVGWGMGQPIYWLLAVLLPVVALTVALSISIGLGYTRTAPASSATGIAALPATRILMTAGLYLLISIPFAFGEEFGWRGYAQGKLVREFGLLPGLLLLGIIWGFWHTPIFYFMGVFPEHPILGPFVLTPIDNILAVVPMGWLYVRSKSIWVPTFTHAFADVLWGFSGLLFPPNDQIHSWAVLQVVQMTISIILLLHWRKSQEPPKLRHPSDDFERINALAGAEVDPE